MYKTLIDAYALLGKRMWSVVGPRPDQPTPCDAEPCASSGLKPRFPSNGSTTSVDGWRSAAGRIGRPASRGRRVRTRTTSSGS